MIGLTFALFVSHFELELELESRYPKQRDNDDKKTAV